MSIDARLTRISPNLSARERAILVLKSWKDETREDPAWRRTMPNEQAREFNRLIDLMNSINIRLGAYIAVLRQDVECVELRKAWMVSMVLWLEHVDEIRHVLRLSVKQPITESAYQSLVDEARSEWVPVAELAELAAEDHEDWADADLETAEGWDQPVVTEAAWDRVAAEKEQELRALVAAGKLTARGRGKALKVQAGAFDDLTGRKTIAMPEEMMAYRVLPDAQADAVAVEQQRLESLRRAVDWQSDASASRGDLIGIEKLRDGVVQGLAVNMVACWLSVRSAEIVIDEAAEEFDGMDPLRPWARKLLDECRESLLEVNRQLDFLNLRMEVVLPEPTDEDIAELRQVARKPIP